MPRHIAEGFVMNFQDESGLDPGINEHNPTVPGSRGGFGLAQWTGPRRVALEAFAAQKGLPASNPEVQMDFLMTELAGPESAAWSRIKATRTSGEAGAAVVNAFLRPAEAHRARREAAYLRGAGGAPATASAPVTRGGGAPVAPRKDRMGILADIGAGLAAQPTAPLPQLLPVQRTPYTPQARDDIGPLLRFFQSIG